MTSPDPIKRICIGKITSSHGVKGLVKIHPYCEDISLLKGTLFTSDNPTDPSTLTITIKSSTGKYLLAQIDGITTPEDAKRIKCSLYIPREELPTIEDNGEFYIEDLIGLSAKTHDHKDILGTIKNIDNFGAGDLLEIAPIDGGTPYYVPFHDDYITDIDLDERCIMLKNTELFRIG
jgi:16S rRNA processing protein RimM